MTEQFEPRAAAKGTRVTVVVGNEERELKAKKAKKGKGWWIRPTDAAEAAALAQFTDEALDPPPPPEPEPETGPAGETEEPAADETEDEDDDDAADDTGEASTFAAANAEAGDGQEES